ncbi:MAG TPA: hypothetical protein VEA99_09850 [Gemmatimonadaceae bacterium]|nr:hypothetical protein [Gemmatimonadaceae bacterium]
MQSTRAFTANAQTQDMDVLNRDVKVTVSGTFVATLTGRVSRDGGATWDTCGMQNTAGAIVSTITAPGRFYPIGLRPGDKFRLETTAYTSGTANATIEDQIG